MLAACDTSIRKWNLGRNVVQATTIESPNLRLWKCHQVHFYSCWTTASYDWIYLELSQPHSLKQGLLLCFPDPLAASNRMIFGSAASDIFLLEYPVLSAAWLNWCSHHLLRIEPISSRVSFRLLPVILLLRFNFRHLIEGAKAGFRTFFVSNEEPL